MTTTHHIKDIIENTDREGWVRRAGIAAAGVALVSATIMVGARATERAELTPATSIGTDSTSVLLDGEAFNQAIAQTVAGAAPERSALLDGEAFNRAITQTVAGVEPGRSVLLDGEAFNQAITQSVAGMAS